jgi:DNA-directed RNA polymerase specialized sigma24 family protein
MLLMREEGFRYREIAAVVNVAPASVGTLLARAVRRFEKALDPVYIEDESNFDD